MCAEISVAYFKELLIGTIGYGVRIQTSIFLFLYFFSKISSNCKFISDVTDLGDYYEKLGLTIIGKIYFWSFAIFHDI